VRRPSTAFQYSSKVACLRSPNSLDHGLQVPLRTRSIIVSQQAASQRPSASPNWLDQAVKVHLQTGSITGFKCSSKLAGLRCPKSLDQGLQLHLQTRSITASKVHPPTRSITAPACIPEFTRSSFSGPPPITLKYRLQPVHIYRMQLGRYIAIQIDRYIDENTN
jgi:hypothetical protein